jgi:type VI secretion system secreted protein VgrG
LPGELLDYWPREARWPNTAPDITHIDNTCACPMKINTLPKDFTGLTEANRPIRLRLTGENAVLDDVLLVRHVSGSESMCGGLRYDLRCVSTQAGLATKQFIAMPVELQFVTDKRSLRAVCGIVEQAIAGEADGGLATYQLIVRDALSIMDKDCASRIFRNCNEVGITETILAEWRRANPVLARAFVFDLSQVNRNYPTREFTMQHNESSAAFLRRLWKRRGLAWFVRPGQATARGSDKTAPHTLVLFDNASCLERNAAGTVRFHRDDATETRDSITAWQGVRTLTPGRVTRRSWDYKIAATDGANVPSVADQGAMGKQLAFAIDDYLVDSPHAGDSRDDYDKLARLRMLRHEYVSKCFQGESGVRDLCVGEWIAVTGHAVIDAHPPEERQFLITELRVEAENNLPKELGERARRLFALNAWAGGDLAPAAAKRDSRYANQFTCVRRGVRIVPGYDPRIDLPRTGALDAVVVGPGWRGSPLRRAGADTGAVSRLPAERA